MAMVNINVFNAKFFYESMIGHVMLEYLFTMMECIDWILICFYQIQLECFKKKIILFSHYHQSKRLYREHQYMYTKSFERVFDTV